MSQIAKKQEILLEAGINELEVVEFLLGNEYYAINVAKVREIIRGNCALVPVPDAPSAIIGVVNLRGSITPVVDLARQLHMEVQRGDRASRIIIAEFNKMTVGFWVSAVTRIHRLSWKQVESPSGVIQTKNAYAVGIVKIDDRILFLLDFEKIASVDKSGFGIQPMTGQGAPQEVKSLRGIKKVMVVEDSSFIAELLQEYLINAGYRVEMFGNGQKAWEALERAAGSADYRKIEDHYHLMITDLEMPQMDGLHLIKKVKTASR